MTCRRNTYSRDAQDATGETSAAQGVSAAATVPDGREGRCGRAGSCTISCTPVPTPAPAYRPATAPTSRPTPAQRALLSALARGRYPLRTTPRTVATCEARGWLRREAHVGLLVLTNAGRALSAAPIAGDWVETIFEPHHPGLVLRVSRNGAWADVRWWERRTAWVKRMPCDSLRAVAIVPFAGGSVTDVTREAELAAAGGEARG